MSLKINKIKLKRFRNYRDIELNLDEHITVLYGPNAVGKTNIVEALQLLTEAVSFKNPIWSDVVSWGEDETSISINASGDGRSRTVEMGIINGKRSYWVNKKKVKSPADITGTIPCVIFTPNDLRIVKDSSERRRDEIDALGSQLSRTYNLLKNEYQKVLAQRNKLLKDGFVDEDILEAWTERLVSIGVALAEQRGRLLTRITPYLIESHNNIDPDNNIQIMYKCTWLPETEVLEDLDTRDKEVFFREMLALRKTEELSRRSTVCGPHRDDIIFLINNKDARTFGSQGQQRSIALAWKLAEVSVINDIVGHPPILLLDDVMSELDDSRRKALTSQVASFVQTVITTANIGYFDKALLDRARVVHVDTLHEAFCDE